MNTASPFHRTVVRTAATLAVAALGVTLASTTAFATTVTSGFDTSNGTGSIGPSSPGAAITRAQIIARADDWMNAQVPYSQNAGWEDSAAGGPYREDCSGFVSMAWGLKTSMVTSTLPQVATVTDSNISGDTNLNPGDALDYTADHVVLFDHWINQSSGTFDYDAEHTTGQVTNQSSGSVYNSTLEGYSISDYEALQYNNLTTPAPSMPAGGELGDVTGDGKPDILGTTPAGLLDLYQNSGQASPNTFNMGPVQVGSGWTNGTSVAAVGDLWGQGRDGILAAAPGGALNYYPNSGQGGANTFDVADTQVGQGFTGYTIIGLTDLFGTGHEGMLVMTPTGDLVYYVNTGNTGSVNSADPTFTSSVTVGTGFSGYTVDVADMDGDGKPDLLAVAPNGNLEYFPNSGGTGAVGTGNAVFTTDTVVGGGFNVNQAVDTAFISGAKGADLVVVSPNGTLLEFANQGGTGATTSSDPMFVGSGVQLGYGWTGLGMN